MKELFDLVDVTTQYIESLISANEKTMFKILSDNFSVIAALLSLGGLVFTSVYAVKNNRKNQNATARVEWIQKVRDTTAELFTLYYTALSISSSSIDKKCETIMLACGRVERLILFFGPEKTKSKNENAKNNQDIGLLLCKSSNVGKNELIVERLVKISDEFMKWQNKIKIRGGYKIDNLQNSLTELRDVIRIYLKIEWSKAKKGK